MTKPILLFFIFLLSACGVQRKMTEARQKTEKAIDLVNKETSIIKNVDQVALNKTESSQMDSIIRQEYNQVLTILDQQVQGIREKSTFIQNALNNKSEFRKKNSLSIINQELATIDSFNLQKESRQRIYDMVTEGVNMKAFNLFDLAAFFDPGVYKVPAGALNKISASFMPALDSMLFLSSKYSDIQRKAYIVFVGYADASPVAEDSPLYAELSQYLEKQHPGSSEVNFALSDLRAKELMQNMKIVILKGETLAKKFESLNISYYGYGKGEALPFAHIKDYKNDDERRRIVLFYWAVLPDISALKN